MYMFCFVLFSLFFVFQKSVCAEEPKIKLVVSSLLSRVWYVPGDYTVKGGESG